MKNIHGQNYKEFIYDCPLHSGYSALKLSLYISHVG